MSWWKTEEVKAAKVMVVGAGALGNEILKNLALLNVGHILIVDFDVIEYSNLSRSVLYRESDVATKAPKASTAAQRIKEINPNIQTQVILGNIILDVGLGVFRRMDVVIGGLDNRLARLFINRHCHKVNKTWVDGAIENLAGQMNVYTPGKSCYECELSESDWENIKNVLGCKDVAMSNTSVGRIPTTPISSSIIAAMQVQEALKVIHGHEDKSMAGQRFFYEGMNNFFFQYKAGALKEDCLAHFLYDPIIEASTLSAKMTVGETLDWLAEYFEEEEPEIQLDYDLVLEVTTRNTEVAKALIIPQPYLKGEIIQQYEEEAGEGLMITEVTTKIDHQFPNKDLSLAEVGIPPLQILRVKAKGDLQFVELTGDEAFLQFS